jgi:hypothetical protein
VERGKIGGPGSGVRCERGGVVSSSKTWGRRAQGAAGESAHVGVPGGDGERERGKEEAGGWASLWDGPHPSAK